MTNDLLTIPDRLRRSNKRGRKPRLLVLDGDRKYIMPDTPEEFSVWPKKWSKGQTFYMYVQGKMPICGYRRVRAVVGRKWVRLCTDNKDSRMRVKWKMSRKEWDRVDAHAC